MNPLLLLPILAQSPEPSGDEAMIVHHMEQARLFVKRGWLDDAATELEKALALPGGESSAELHWMMSQLQWALFDAEAALRHARAAAALSRDSPEGTQAAQTAAWLTSDFGVLTLTAPYEGNHSRLQLESVGLVLDPELKRFIDGVALAWTSPQDLPLKVRLPAGDYSVQGLAVSVPAGGEVSLALPLSALGAGGFAALQVSRLELGLGVGMWLGQPTQALRPSAELQAGFTQPVGPWLIGLTGDLALLSWQAPQGQLFTRPGAGSIGLRLGRELPVSGPLSLRPSLGYRVLRLPGQTLACSDLDLAACSPAWGEAVGPVTVSASSWVQLPYAELSLDWRRAGRSTATGLGVRVQGGYGLGVLPAQAQATLPDGSTLDFTVDDRAWGSPWLRFLSELSLAF